MKFFVRRLNRIDEIDVDKYAISFEGYLTIVSQDLPNAVFAPRLWALEKRGLVETFMADLETELRECDERASEIKKTMKRILKDKE